MPEDPDKGLHRNRPISVPEDKGPRNCFSVTDILQGKTPAAWGSEQSAQIATFGQDAEDPTTWTKKWYTPGRYLRVPKAVVLSSMPQWTLFWPKCYFYMPRDVINDDGYGALGNYYYLEQWNALDPSATSQPDYGWVGPDASDSSFEYQNNPAWKDFKFLTDSDKSTVYNAKQSCTVLASGPDSGCESVPSYVFNMCVDPPQEERFQVKVGEVENPYYGLHKECMAAFVAAKAILEGDKNDPILVSIPNWMPTKLYQVRNAYLKRFHEKLNGEHGGAVNKNPCDIKDATPCYTHEPICWAPPYPDKDAPSSRMPFQGPTVPWILSADPGVGTNTLHLYVGHPNMAYFATDTIFDYQSWPLTPEMQWIVGPVASGVYTGSSIPFFAGRRLVWRAFGFDYGYAVHGALGLWNSRYSTVVAGAAGQYKQNFWKMRNQGTRIFTYAANWNFQWNFENLDKDRRNDCPATQFYGFNFDDYASTYDSEDQQIADCAGTDPAHLHFGETTNFFPTKAEIQRAKQVGGMLTKRVEDYYKSNDAGSAEFFRIALDRTGLTDYNCSYEGVDGFMTDPDGIVEYVRAYFKGNN